MKVDALKDTSKLVGNPAPGAVYKNINIWIDFKRVKNAIIRYKIENSWIKDNGLSDDKIKMSKWDINNKRWIELSTITTNKDDSYTYFESQTDTIPASFAIHSIGDGKVNPTTIQTPVTNATSVIPATSVTKTSVIPAAPVATSKPRAEFEIGMLVYPSSFKSENNSGNYASILDKLIE